MPLDIEGWYERYGPMVLRRCRALLRDEARAQDAMQDVFVSVLRFGGRLDDRQPAALLLRIATNVCLNKIRGQKRKAEDMAGGPDGMLERIAAADEDAEGAAVARNLLGKLFRPDDPLAASTRTIAVMHLCDGMTLEEVARESGMSVSGVRKRLRSLRGRLVELEAA